MAEKCMEMDEWEKKPQTSGGHEMQGLMPLFVRVQWEEWIQWRQWKWHIDQSDRDQSEIMYSWIEMNQWLNDER